MSSTVVVPMSRPPLMRRYRVRTEGSDYLLTLAQSATKRLATLEGFSTRLRTVVSAEDVDPEVGEALLFETPPSEWLGRTLRVGTIRTSEIRELAAADGEWGDSGTRISRIDRTAAARPSAIAARTEMAPAAAARDSGQAKKARPEELLLRQDLGTFRDLTHELEWELHVTPAIDFKAARAYASGLKLDGGGWRLPTPEELRTLLRTMWGSNAPWVWTSRIEPSDLELALAYWPATGEARPWLRTNGFSVRCVRAVK